VDASNTNMSSDLTIGQTSPKIYWSVFLTSLLVLLFMAYGIVHGRIALAATVPVPLQVTASSLQFSNVSLSTAIEKNNTPIFVTRSDLTATNLVQTLDTQVPLVGKVRLHLRVDKAVIHGLVARIPNTTGQRTLSFPNLQIDSALFSGNVSLTLTQ
jgi:hypothetical protein